MPSRLCRASGLWAVALLLATRSAAQAPSNDDHNNAQRVFVPSSVTGTTVGATRGHDEFGAPCTPGGPSRDNLQSIWFEVLPGFGGQLTLDLAGTAFDAVVSVEYGSGSVVACAATDAAGAPKIERLPVERNRSYFVRVSGVGAGAEGTVALAVSLDPPEAVPPNDDRANAAPLTTDGFVAASQDGATSEPGEAPASCTPSYSTDSGRSLWWTYTAPADTTITVDLSVGNYRLLSLHRPDGTELACSTARIARVPVAAGETVLLRASSQSIFAGPFAFAFWTGANGAPPNDDRDQAGPIVRETTYAGTTTGATAAPGEAGASCVPGGAALDTGRSVWWRYEPAGNRMVTVSAPYAGPVVLSVHAADGTELACGAGPTGPLVENAPVPGGQTAYIRVSTYRSAPDAPAPEGYVSFRFRSSPALVNDFVATATVIAEPGTVAGTTVTATAEPGEQPVSPVCLYGHYATGPDAMKSAWWTYTAPVEGALLVDLDGSDYNTVLSIHDDALAELACNDVDPTNTDTFDYTSRIVNLPVAAGQRVLIRVSGHDTDSRPLTGNVQLRLELLPATMTTTVTTGTTVGGPTWERPVVIPGDPVCGFSFEVPTYQATPFTVPQSAFYSFTSQFDGFEGCLYVYEAPFDPVQRCGERLLLGDCNRTATPGQTALPGLELVAGVPYVLVASGEDEEDAGTYTLSALGPAAVAFGAVVAGEGGAPSETSLSAPTPNPAAGAATVTLALAAPSTLTVDVVDVLGRRVAVLHDGPLAAGLHAVALDGAALPAGTYVVRAMGDGVRLGTRFTVVR